MYKKKTDQVWKRASSLLNKVVESSTIYFYVTKDCNGLGLKLQEYWSQNESIEKSKKDKVEEKLINKCPELNFQICFSEEE